MPVIQVIDRKRTFELPAGLSILEGLIDQGVNIMHACGGNCICGTCNVEILEGMEHLAQPSEAERIILSKLIRQGPRVRLSCQCFPAGDIVMRIAP